METLHYNTMCNTAHRLDARHDSTTNMKFAGDSEEDAYVSVEMRL
jgi:hypothetical protein